MVNQQLVAYIKQQMQLGESETPIKNSLRSVGWSETDIADAFRSLSPASPVAKPALNVSSVAKGANPVPSSVAPISVSISANAAKPKEATFSKPSSIGTPYNFSEKESSGGGKGAMIGMIAMGIVIIGLGVFAGMLFRNNSILKGETTDLKNQVSALTNKVDASNVNSSGLSNQMKKLEEDIVDLESQLALFLPLKMVPVTVNSTSSQGGPTTVNIPAPVTLKGTLSENKDMFTLTTSKGVAVTIKNSKDAKVLAALKPLAGSMIQITGTPTSGAREISATHVNGALIQ